jgi:hypothetical protein
MVKATGWKNWVKGAVLFGCTALGLASSHDIARSHNEARSHNVASAQDPSLDRDYEIRLRSRRFTPGETQTLSLLPTKRWHGLIQFDKQPSSATLAALTAKGVRIQHSVSPTTVAASIPPGFNPGSIAGVRWSGKLAALDKKSRRISKKRDTNLVVEFFPDATDEEIRSAIAAAGGQKLHRSSLPENVAYVVLQSPTEVDTLAAADAVAYITAAPAPMIEGKPTHYCPGPLGPNGPVADYVGEYVLQGSGWDGAGLNAINLSYKFVNSTPDLTQAQQRTEMRKAMDTWSKYAQITWTETSISGLNRSFDISFASGDHGDSAPFDGPSGVLAHCYYPNPPNSEPVAGDAHFDEAETWRVGSNIDLYSVALHEFGHGLGLNHSDDTNAVMYAFYQIVTDLRADDINGIRALYAPSTVPPPTPPANDPFSGAFAISGSSGTTSGTNVNATAQTGEPNLGSTTNQTVWWKWTGSGNGTATFDTFGSNFDTVLDIYTGSSITALTLVATNDDTDGVQSKASFTATQGTVYYVRVRGYHSEDTGSITLNWMGPAPPTGSGTISGFVRNSANTGVGGVSLKTTIAGVVTTALTSSTGFYQFNNVPTSSTAYKVAPAKAGYYFVPASKAVTVTMTALNPVANFTALEFKATDIGVSGDNKAHVLLANKSGKARHTLLNTDGTYSISAVDTLTGWVATATAVGADGNKRVLWWKASTREFSVSVYTPAGVLSTRYNFDLDVVLGTIAPGHVAVDLVVDADNRTRVLLKKTDNSIIILNVNTPPGVAGSIASVGAVDGPFTGWVPLGIGVGADGSNRVLWWNKTTRQVVISFYNALGNFTTDGALLAVPTGYTPIDVVTGADNKTRVLLGKSGYARVWQLSTNGVAIEWDAIHIVSGATSIGIGVGGDNKARVLLNRTDGRYVVLQLSTNGVTAESTFNFPTGG